MADLGGFLGSLVSGGFELFGNDQKYKETQAINAQNFQNSLYFDTHHIQDVVGDAKAAGINPLAALGSTTPSAPVAVGSGQEGIGRAGQDFGRAVSSLMQQDDKDEALKRRLLQLQIDGAEQDVVSKQLQNSKNATTMGAAGNPPGVPSSSTRSTGIPLPRPRPGAPILEYDPPTPLYQTFVDDKGDRVRLLGKEASQSLMNSASMPISVPIGAQMLVGNTVDLTAQHVRPDVLREWSRGVFGGADRPAIRRRDRYHGGFWDR